MSYSSFDLPAVACIYGFLAGLESVEFGSRHVFHTYYVSVTRIASWCLWLTACSIAYFLFPDVVRAVSHPNVVTVTELYT